ncbi:MAG: hypothetical protein QXG45_00065 [Nitrososphaerota archaeon]
MNKGIKVLNIFLGSKARRGWPSPFYDYDARAKEWISRLDELKSQLPVEFMNRVISTMDEVNRLEREIDNSIDAIFVYILTSESTRFTYLASKRIADLGYDYIHKYGGYGIPTVYVIDLYGGDISGLPLVEDLEKTSRRFLIISSNDIGEIVKALRVVYAIKMLNSSKILVITRREANPAKYLSPQYVGLVKQRFGVSLEYVDYSDVKALYDEVDMDAAEKLAKKVMEKALEVREPSKSEIVKAAAIYLSLKKLLEKHGANALAIDCLGWLEYGKVEMPTTPCLALSLLNDEGYVAACEADVHSALTMLVFRYLAGRASFISDPVVDVAENAVIHCHCTAPTKMDGEAAPYVIRNHADSGDGVGLQVFMREGVDVTVAKFIEGLNEMFVSVGKTLGNVNIDRGCRTKVKVSVPDARKYLCGYKGGLHRVLAYGNHLTALEDLSRLMGFKLTLEGV